MTEEKKEIHRGDIYFADLSPTVGCEKGGISVPIKLNDIGNLYSPTVIVAPITGRAKKWLPTHAILHCTGLDKRSCVLLEQLRTIDKDRLVDYIGRLEQSQLNKINETAQLSLGLETSL
ncbi:MAG: type II toxin-antitoxin system PemK/MazF family toxin [Oscillospiraceae bacterium]